MRGSTMRVLTSGSNMRDFLRQNKGVILAAVVTLVLAIIAILTAVRFYQLRRQAVAPTAPEEPEAAAPSPTPGGELPSPAPECSLTFVVSSPTPTVTNTPTPTATFTPTPTNTPTTTPTYTPTPTVTNTPTPTFTPTLTPTLPPTAQCIEIRVYDTSWVLLTGADLVNLKAGDTVRFAVLGSTTAGIFDKAVFSINGQLTPEVTDKKPGTEEFYYEYTITEADLGTTFSVQAWVHHATLDRWF